VRRDRAIHLVAAAAALLAWGIWDRFGAVLAGDVEALIENLVRDWTTDFSQAPYARAALVAPFRAAVRFGPVPLWCVVVAGTVYRLSAGEEGDHPLSRLGRGAKLCVGALTLGPFAAAAFPLGLGLSVWVAVELYGWLEWYGDVDPTMLWIHEVAPWLLLPGVATAGVAGLVFALSESPDPVLKKRRRRSRIRRLARIAAVVPLAPLAVAGVLGGAHAQRVSRVGADVHEARCGRCHERALPLYYVKAPDEWARTLTTHVSGVGVELAPAERDVLLTFLTSNRSAPDGAAFSARCGGCHGTTWRGWSPRTESDWDGIVGRIAQWSPYWYRADVRAQLLRFLAAQGLVRTDDGLLDLAPPAAAEVRELVRLCGFCHSVSYEAARYAAAPPDEVRRMTARMNDKLHLGLRLDDGELEAITRIYARWIAEPGRWDHLVPHDRPELATGRGGDEARPGPGRY
jgi:hypothetical protein